MVTMEVEGSKMDAEKTEEWTRRFGTHLSFPDMSTIGALFLDRIVARYSANRRADQNRRPRAAHPAWTGPRAAQPAWTWTEPRAARPTNSAFQPKASLEPLRSS